MLDAHGHGHEAHDEYGRAPTLIAFGGVVTPERIPLPTTLIHADK